MTIETDIVVIGAGLAGHSAALEATGSFLAVGGGSNDPALIQIYADHQLDAYCSLVALGVEFCSIQMASGRYSTSSTSRSAACSRRRGYRRLPRHDVNERHMARQVRRLQACCRTLYR